MSTKVATPHTEDTILKETAVAIGGAAGKVAALAKSAFGHSHAEPAKVVQKSTGRFAPSQKTRMPRKQKKALAKHKQ